VTKWSDSINTLSIEAKLAEKYGYTKLPGDLSLKYRNFFAENIPDFLCINGCDDILTTTRGTSVCNGYNRIVVGDYGAFVEFTPAQANMFMICVQGGQEYRIRNLKYSQNVKYEWLTIRDGSEIKIYRQKKRVVYADYKPTMYYISVHECNKQ
jgi:hypothetical protein